MLAVAARTATSGKRELCVESFPSPVLNQGEVLLRITVVGICGTDLEILSGYKPLPDAQILGHEFLAEVLSYASDVPNDLRLEPGTRVVAEINCVLPGSASRTASQRAQDPRRTAIGIFGRQGAFAELIAVPVQNVHTVPASIPDEAAVFTEPIAAVCQIMEQITLPRSARVAVLGAGRLGWLIAHVLSACGSDVTVLTRGRHHLRDAPLASQFKVALEDITKEHGQLVNFFDVVVDCTGSSSGLVSAIDFVRPRGTILLKSTTAPGKGEAVDLTSVVVKEITVVGSRCGPFPAALRLLEKGIVDPRVLIDSVFDKKNALDAFKRAQQNGVLKVLIRWTQARTSLP